MIQHVLSIFLNVRSAGNRCESSGVIFNSVRSVNILNVRITVIFVKAFAADHCETWKL